METKELNSYQDDWSGIALPIVLMLTGMILVGGDLLGVLSLDGIRNWWPVALIAIGAAELATVRGREL